MSRLTQIRKSLADAEGLPNGVRFYLFGSVVDGSLGSDIDLLCVYDAEALPPEKAYTDLKPLFDHLHDRFGSPVHPVLLTNSEEAQVNFIESEECVPVVE
jgi:predicted nucleotidyltransferase